MKATLKNHHQTPRKVRLVADAIRGKSVENAKRTLLFLNKKAAAPVEKLLDSAVANAEAVGASPADLVVKTITVNKGSVAKRYRPFARGRAGSIRKIMSHISIELAAVPHSAKKPTRRAMAKTPAKAAAPAKK